MSRDIERPRRRFDTAYQNRPRTEYFSPSGACSVILCVKSSRPPDSGRGLQQRTFTHQPNRLFQALLPVRQAVLVRNADLADITGFPQL